MPWYRTVEPETEIKVLATRENLSDEALQEQRVRCPQGYNHNRGKGCGKNNFTFISAFHYLKEGKTQALFNSSEEQIGVMLKRYSEKPRSVIWRDSGRCDVTDDIFKKYHPEEAFEKLARKQALVVMTEDMVAREVSKRFRDMQKAYRKEGHDVKDTQIAWTEGLFRYKFDEIDGVVVNPDNTNSCAKGYAFAKVVEANRRDRCRFYSLDQKTSSFTELDREDIKQKISRCKMQVRELCRKYSNYQRLPGREGAI